MAASKSGYLLVDTGIPGRERSIDSPFKRWGINPISVSYIILTHGHLDYIGCLAYVRDLSGAKVICHSSLAASCYKEAVPRAGIWCGRTG